MFPRTVKVRSKSGVLYEYVRFVEPYREDGKNKQRTVLNLGRKDLLKPHLDAIVRILTEDESEDEHYVRVRDLETVDAWTWGPVLALRTLWRQLDLDNILDRLDPPGGRDGVSLADRAFVLVANRLIRPGSEHALANWLESDYVCDRKGRRFKPAWRDDEQRRKSSSPRVRVEPRQLQRWYRTLDRLHAQKSAIEVQLYEHLRDLFSWKWTSPSTISLRLTSKATVRNLWRPTVTAATLSRASGKSWSAWSWSRAGLWPITSSGATCAIPRRCARCLRISNSASAFVG